ncbi:MAG: hypothetical protein ABI860_03190 [Gemmatimonadales bacterium]
MGSRRVLLLLFTALVVFGPGSALAQSAAVAWQATPASVLKAALRSAAAAQARYRAQNGAYAPEAEQLALRLESGVHVDVIGVGSGGWQGRATHFAQPGRSCVIFVGRLDGADAPRTDGDREMAGEAGIPLCDRMR